MVASPKPGRRHQQSICFRYPCISFLAMCVSIHLFYTFRFVYYGGAAPRHREEPNGGGGRRSGGLTAEQVAMADHTNQGQAEKVAALVKASRLAQRARLGGQPQKSAQDMLREKLIEAAKLKGENGKKAAAAAAALGVHPSQLPPREKPKSRGLPRTAADLPPPKDCYARRNTEYDGPVVLSGPGNIQPTAAACCQSCKEHRAKSELTEDHPPACSVWVWCPDKAGCGGQQFGECWGKVGFEAGGSPIPKVRAAGENVPWMSGAALTPTEAAALAAAEREKLTIISERRSREGNPKVFFDVRISGGKGKADVKLAYGEEPGEAGGDGGAEEGAAGGGRIEFVLYARESPRATENFRAMCTGEKVTGPSTAP